MKLKFLAGFLSLSAIFCFENCKGPETPDTEEFNRTLMLVSVSNRVIIPNLNTFTESTASLQIAVNALTANVGNSELTAAQSAFETTLYQWKQCELFDVGEVSSSYLYNRIESDYINPTFIQTILTGSETVTTDLLETKGSNVKGLKTLEYFLYHSSHNSDSVLYFLTQDSLSAKRLEYLNALVENLNDNAAKVLDIWTGTTNYKNTFVENNTMEISGSIGLLFNQNIALLERDLHTRIGGPLGKSSVDGVDPALVEYYRCKASLSSLKGNIESMKGYYFGSSDIANTEGVGLDNFILNVESNGSFSGLSAKTIAAYNDIDNAIESIDNPLQEALISESEKVETLYTSLQNLLVIYKTEIPSALGITITFNDNDGD